MSFNAEISNPGVVRSLDGARRKARPRPLPQVVHSPRGTAYDDPRDWGQIGAFAAGIAIGAIAGAGVALLLAPASGEETRAGIWGRATSAWDDLGRELRVAARQGRKKVSRGVTRGSWAAEDVVDRVKG